MNKPSIIVDNVSMTFSLSKARETRLKEYVLNMVRGINEKDQFHALKDVSLEIQKGESWGLIGVNGSGKSTLLKIISRIINPTEGSVLINGTVAPLIEMGGGFDNDLTARENIYLVGAMHGHSRPFIDKKFNSIVAFSELKDFIDSPLRTYSSGMRARLGFSIATLVNADILIADEVLSVGDALFRKKCENRIANMVKEGTTVIFVSHSIGDVMNICSKAVWLEKGKIRMIGSSNEVCSEYKRVIG